MDILFAVLPFADLQAPAIGVSLLKPAIESRGHSAAIRYFSFSLAETLGIDLYNAIAGYGDYSGVASAPPTETLVGEWFFAREVFGDALAEDEAYLDAFLRSDAQFQDRIPKILGARESIGDWVESCVAEIQALRPSIVGFTTSFYQTCACLAVARRLKEGPDPPIVVFGGANCAGLMGEQLARSFPFIDYVCTGEGDLVFPEFVSRLLETKGATRLEAPGMAAAGRSGSPGPAPMARDLDALPMPDYDDYFRALDASSAGKSIQSHLLVETARGCWWGAKHHCTFCGLNTETMAFRAKSADRALEEMLYLSRRFGLRQIDCVDNILHLPYVNSLFPRLVEEGADLQLFYETKANLKRPQLEALRDGGVWCIQPGIESFSDPVLDLMNKGCNGIQNIRILRWGAEMGMEVIWNIIFGFPGERAEDYEAMADLVPLLVHLRQPTFAVRVRLDRFSPFFMDPQGHGMTEVRPARAYRYVFPLGESELRNLAYFFDFEYADGRDPFDYTRRLRAHVAEWARLQSLAPEARPLLEFLDAPGVAMIRDTRPCATAPVTLLDPLDADLYRVCDEGRTAPAAARALGRGLDEVEERLARLVAARLMVEMGGRHLSLAVFRTATRPAAIRQAADGAPRPTATAGA